MFPLNWSTDREGIPENVLKLWMYVEASISDLNDRSKAGVAVTMKCLCLPVIPYSSSPRNSSVNMESLNGIVPFKIEFMRKGGSQDDNWEFKFHQFSCRVPAKPHNTQPDRFRGYFGLRLPCFGSWEPFSHFTFLEGDIVTTVANETSRLSCILPEFVVDLSSTSFCAKSKATNGTHNANTIILETLLCVQFCSSKTNPSSKIFDLEMKAAVSSWNFSQSKSKTDCTLTLNQELFFCNSEKISRLSHLLHGLFDMKIEENTSSRMTKDWTSYFSLPSSLQLFLRFAYYNELPSPHRNNSRASSDIKALFDLLKFAHMFDIPILRDAAEISLVDSPPSGPPAISAVDLTVGLQIYSFTKNVKSLKRLRIAVGDLLRKQAPEFNKNELVKFARTDPQSIVEILQLQLPVRDDGPPAKLLKLIPLDLPILD